MILLIVDLSQYCVCCIRSGVIGCTLLMVLYLNRMCQLINAGYMWCSGRTSVYLCAASLQNLEVPHNFCSPLSVQLERSCCPRTYSMVWDWRVSRSGQCFFIGLSYSIPMVAFYYFYLSLLSVYWLVLWGRGLRTDMVYITLLALHCRPLLIIIMIIIY